MPTRTAVGGPFDEQRRLDWAKTALDQAAQVAKAANTSGQVPLDLIPPDGWRWRVLEDLDSLSKDLNRNYDQARSKQSKQAWQSRFGGPLATGGGAAIGSIVSAVGAGVVEKSTSAGWAIVVFGVLFAIVGSIFSSNSYVQNRNKRLRFLRLLHDIWDYAYMVLPSTTPAEAFSQLDTFRQLWETAGS